MTYRNEPDPLLSPAAKVALGVIVAVVVVACGLWIAGLGKGGNPFGPIKPSADKRDADYWKIALVEYKAQSVNGFLLGWIEESKKYERLELEPLGSYMSDSRDALQRQVHDDRVLFVKNHGLDITDHHKSFRERYPESSLLAEEVSYAGKDIGRRSAQEHSSDLMRIEGTAIPNSDTINRRKRILADRCKTWLNLATQLPGRLPAVQNISKELLRD